MYFAARLKLVMVIIKHMQSIYLGLKRLGWMLLIWTASVLTLAVAAYTMRLFMHLIGLY